MLHSLSTAYRSWAFKVTIWVILAAIAAGLTFMVWVASAVKPVKSLTQKNTDNPTVADPVALLAAHTPTETAALVKPITFDAVIRDMRNYPAEFKDSRFIKDNAGKWTVQIMNVVEHEVVTDYLNSRTDDRNQFNYFRIVDKNNQKRFVLTYGVFNSVEQAIGASKTVMFNLPANVTTFPEEFSRYAPQMDEYEVTPPLKDTGKNAPRAVKLKSTQKPLPAPKAKPNPTATQTPATDEKPKPKPAAQKPSIEKSQNRNETLNIQETRDKNIGADTPAQPLPIQKSEPPVIKEPTPAKEKLAKETAPKEKPAKEKPVKEKPVVKEKPAKDTTPKEQPVKEKPVKEAPAAANQSG